MSRSLDIAASGMLAQQLNVDVISNNIANMSTTGYKRQRAEFQDLIYQNIDRPGGTSSDAGTVVPSGLQLGLGVQTGSVYREFSQGSVNITENELDVAILGQGFFQVQLPSGETAYTRAGSFQVNESGELVTIQGYAVDPGITLPTDTLSVDINASGEVLAQQPNTTAPTNVGQLQLANFINPAGLNAIGNNMYLETEASGTPTTGNPSDNEFGSLEQGMLEDSNVNVVQEMTMLIEAQRAYELNSNVISTSDEMLQTINQIR